MVSQWDPTRTGPISDWSAMRFLQGAWHTARLGTAEAPASLLLRDEVPWVWAFSPQAPPKIADGIVGSRACYRVDYFPTPGRAVQTAWIDKKTFLLLRLDDASGYTSVYEPEANVAIDRGWFAFDPKNEAASPLQYTGQKVHPSDN